MIASLPMYDRPALRAAHLRLWEALDLGLPRSEPDDLWAHWHDPDLLFTQTCGLPFAMGLHAHLTLIGAPDFRLAGCPPGYYNSVLLTRADDAREQIADFTEARVAYTQPHSQSGWGALYAFATERGTRLRNLVETGSHAASAEALLAEQVDLASLDAQTFRLLCREDPRIAALRILARTPPQPATPYVTHFADEADDLRRRLGHAIAALTAEDRETLGLFGLVTIPREAYLALPIPPQP